MKKITCVRENLVTIHTHNTLPIHFPTLLPMRVHNIQRCRTLNIAILTPEDMMLLKLKYRKKYLILMFQLRHFLQHILCFVRLTQTLMSCFSANNQVPFEICAKTTFQIYFLKQSFKFIL